MQRQTEVATLHDEIAHTAGLAGAVDYLAQQF
jgi:hypothetical protein